MPTLGVLILNGVSGTGKTSTAETLSNLICDAFWIHPDALWDTPRMDPETILQKALEHAFQTQQSGLAIIDCQVRPTSIPVIMDTFDIRSWLSVLHTCSPTARETRLLERGWNADSFQTIANWSDILHKESVDAGNLVVNTSADETDVVCDLIIKHALERGLLGRQKS